MGSGRPNLNGIASARQVGYSNIYATCAVIGVIKSRDEGLFKNAGLVEKGRLFYLTSFK